MKVTHLNLSEQTRTLAAIRAAMLGRSMSGYITDLVILDAEHSGVAALVREEATVEMYMEAK